MSKRAAGIAFCSIAAFIFAIPYFVVGFDTIGDDRIIMSGLYFNKYLKEICAIPMLVSAFMLVGGIGYLVSAEKADKL